MFQIYNSKVKLLLIALTAKLMILPASAHFCLFNSREMADLKGDQVFWPIRGSNSDRPNNSNCLELAPAKALSGQLGSTIPLSWNVGNHAAHVGVCVGSIYDRKTNQQVADLGSQKDCVPSGAFQAKIPTSVSCSECVIKLIVTATHIPTRPEDYDSCVDIDIAGGGGGGSPAAPNPATTPTTPTTTTVATTTTTTSASPDPEASAGDIGKVKPDPSTTQHSVALTTDPQKPETVIANPGQPEGPKDASITSVNNADGGQGKGNPVTGSDPSQNDKANEDNGGSDDGNSASDGTDKSTTTDPGKPATNGAGKPTPDTPYVKRSREWRPRRRFHRHQNSDEEPCDDDDSMP